MKVYGEGESVGAARATLRELSRAAQAMPRPRRNGEDGLSSTFLSVLAATSPLTSRLTCWTLDPSGAGRAPMSRGRQDMCAGASLKGRGNLRAAGYALDKRAPRSNALTRT